MVRAGHAVPVLRCPARLSLNVEISARYRLDWTYAELFSVQPLALSGENKVPMVRVEHQFPGRLLVFHSLKDLWISATIPLRDLWGGAKITDLIGLWLGYSRGANWH
jgi:hypothetical protein